MLHRRASLALAPLAMAAAPTGSSAKQIEAAIKLRPNFLAVTDLARLK